MYIHKEKKENGVIPVLQRNALSTPEKVNIVSNTNTNRFSIPEEDSKCGECSKK